MPLTHQELQQRRAAERVRTAVSANTAAEKASVNAKADTEKTTVDAKALLDTANSASQTVAVLHVAFMAVCAYVLVIMFGTTDLDLLLGGDNIKLPVIDVAVPLIGFYAFAPYLVVLMHLNLLLQLQLLSRKLFAFDTLTPVEQSIGGLRDRLHIFPYTYYLVGRTGPVVGGLLGLLVSITLMVLPLATLLALQLRFLAYQAEGITWAQRVAVLLDVGLLAALWPVILHPQDDWRSWWRETLAAHFPKKRDWLAVVAMVLGVTLILFAATPDIFTVGLLLSVAAPVLLIVLDGGFSDERIRRTIVLFGLLSWLAATLWALLWKSADSLPSVEPEILVALYLTALGLAFFWHPKPPRGKAFLSLLILAPLLTMGLMVDGEFWETVTVAVQKPFLSWYVLAREEKKDYRRSETLAKQFDDDCKSIGQTVLSCLVLSERRRLDLSEQALFAKQPDPELLAALRAGKGLENKDKVERISLVGRSLRHANLIQALLTGADLRKAQLEGANLERANLQGADLERANLQGADLERANLQGAFLHFVQLQGADLERANLQGANLLGAQLQGADLEQADLQGAYLGWVELQGADLGWVELQGANLERANLQGANLERANLQGANLQGAALYRNLNRNLAQSDLLDIRRTMVEPLSQQVLSEIKAILAPLSFHTKEYILQRLKWATKPGAIVPTFASCLIDQKTQPKCHQAYGATNLDQQHEFTQQLHAVLATLACENEYAAHGILIQIPDSSLRKKDSTRAGLATVLLARLKSNPACPGLSNLSPKFKAELERLAKWEAEQIKNAASTDQQ